MIAEKVLMCVLPSEMLSKRGTEVGIMPVDARGATLEQLVSVVHYSFR